MKQIYNFSAAQPPALTEQSLRELEGQRQLRRQTLVLGIAGVLMQLCMVLAALLLWDGAPALAFGCLAYVILSLLGGGSIILVYRQKGWVLKWQMSQ